MKSDGTKRRIHHVSYPPNDPNSINCGIPELYESISYSGITEAISAIQQFGNSCTLVKRDFASAFRHIPVSSLDMPLLGFCWQNTYNADQYLPFGLRTAPYIFNLFAEMFHWILEDELQRIALPAKIVHYLDDFLIILPSATTTDLNINTTRFSELCQEVGHSIKESKNEEGTIASFGGIAMERENMVIRLPEKNLLKAQQLVQNAIDQTSLSLVELQKLTGYLNFIAKVVPLGRTVLRSLYNMQLYIRTERTYYRRRISSEAQRDLTWWQKVLTWLQKGQLEKSEGRQFQCGQMLPARRA